MMFTKAGKFIIFSMSILLVLFVTRILVFATDREVDSSNQGSICVSLLDPTDGSAINAASFNLYALAEPAQIKGEDTFLYTAAFENCGIEINLEQADALAENMTNYAEDRQIAATSRKFSENGRVCFSGLAAGLYLLVQEGSVAGYYPASPFLVSLPLLKADGSTTYKLEAKPKIEKADIPEPEAPAETEPPAEPEPPALPDPEAGRLIQTGQLNWPIPVLAAGGFILFSYGWPVFFKKEEKENDEDKKNQA